MGKHHDVHRDIYGNVTHISSSDGTETRPIRDIYGNITGYETKEKETSSSSALDSWARGKAIEIIFSPAKFYAIASLVVLGIGLIAILVVLIISHITGIDAATILNDAFKALHKILQIFNN